MEGFGVSSWPVVGSSVSLGVMVCGFWSAGWGLFCLFFCLQGFCLGFQGFGVWV